MEFNSFLNTFCLLSCMFVLTFPTLSPLSKKQESHATTKNGKTKRRKLKRDENEHESKISNFKPETISNPFRFFITKITSLHSRNFQFFAATLDYCIAQHTQLSWISPSELLLVVLIPSVSKCSDIWKSGEKFLILCNIFSCHNSLFFFHSFADSASRNIAAEDKCLWNLRIAQIFSSEWVFVQFSSPKLHSTQLFAIT